jgi:hypothetical protein
LLLHADFVNAHTLFQAFILEVPLLDFGEDHFFFDVEIKCKNIPYRCLEHYLGVIYFSYSHIQSEVEVDVGVFWLEIDPCFFDGDFKLKQSLKIVSLFKLWDELANCAYINLDVVHSKLRPDALRGYLIAGELTVNKGKECTIKSPLRDNELQTFIGLYKVVLWTEWEVTWLSTGSKLAEGEHVEVLFGENWVLCCSVIKVKLTSLLNYRLVDLEFILVAA